MIRPCAYVGDFGESEASLRKTIANVPLSGYIVGLIPVVIVHTDGLAEIWLKPTANQGVSPMTEAATDYRLRLEGWFLAHKTKNISLHK